MTTAGVWFAMMDGYLQTKTKRLILFNLSCLRKTKVVAVDAGSVGMQELCGRRDQLTLPIMT